MRGSCRQATPVKGDRKSKVRERRWRANVIGSCTLLLANPFRDDEKHEPQQVGRAGAMRSDGRQFRVRPYALDQVLRCFRAERLAMIALVSCSLRGGVAVFSSRTEERVSRRTWCRSLRIRLFLRGRRDVFALAQLVRPGVPWRRPSHEFARGSQEFSRCIRLDFDAAAGVVHRRRACYGSIVSVNSTRFLGVSRLAPSLVIVVDTRPGARHAQTSIYRPRASILHSGSSTTSSRPACGQKTFRPTGANYAETLRIL